MPIPTPIANALRLMGRGPRPGSAWGAILFVLAALTLVPSRAAAQALGYGVVGPAGYSGFFGTGGPLIHAAGGAEVLAGGRAGVGGEFGLLAGSGGAFLVSSANGVVHLGRRDRGRGASPFVTGGYSRLSSGEGGFDAWNVGAGADIWAKERVGVRVEFRDHVRPDRRGAVHYWTVRAGVVFR
jgi:hypothetical protein